MDKVRTVKEFQDVFPEELLGLHPNEKLSLESTCCLERRPCPSHSIG